VFRQAGREGRGTLCWKRIADYVQDLANVASQLPGPAVVISHSMGGSIVQKYLEDHPAPAAVLLASAPPAGVLPAFLRSAKRHPLVFATRNLTLRLYPAVATSKLAREFFLSEDMPEEQLLLYGKQLQDETTMASVDRMGLDLPKTEKVRTPLLVLGGSRDNILRPSEMEATDRACRVPHEFFPETTHNMMLESRGQAVAERVLAWLIGRQLMQEWVPRRANRLG